MTRERIALVLDDGTIAHVDGWVYTAIINKGLVKVGVHRHPKQDDYWTVTHIMTGRRLIGWRQSRLAAIRAADMRLRPLSAEQFAKMVEHNLDKITV